MRVCVVDMSGPFGPLRSYLGLAPALVGLGLEFDFVLPEHSVDAVTSVVPDARLDVVTLAHSVRRDITIAQAVRRSVRAGSHVVHANSTSTVRGATLGVLGRSVPLVVHLRNSRLSALERAMLWATAHCGHEVRFVAVSSLAAAVAGASVARRSTVLKDTVPPVPVRPNGGLGDAPKIGVVVNQQPTKGFDVFAETAVLLRADAVQWEVFGSAGLEPPANSFVAGARSLISEAGLDDNVRYHGTVSDLVDRFSQLDAVFITSRRESFSLVCAEAMRAGTPLIAPQIPGLMETIADGRYASTYQVADPNSAAAAIRGLVSSYESALRNAEAARIWASEAFDPDRLALQMMDVYRARK